MWEQVQMDIRNSYDNLKQIIGTQSTSGATVSSKVGNSSTSASGFDSDQAQVSSAANLITLAASSSDVRMDKVQSVKSAIEAGTYNVDPSAVASKVIDNMLGKTA